MYPMIACVTYGREPIFNNCQRCAERNLIKALVLEAGRQGVHPSCLAHWIHRKYGDVMVRRDRGDGTMGTSIPCVVCRKALDKLCIQWRAHIGDIWFRSTDPNAPKSRPTNRQIKYLNFRP